MKLINNTPDGIGNYGVIQTAPMDYVPEHMALWPDELETQTYAKYMGFVTIEFETVGAAADPEPEEVVETEPTEDTETEPEEVIEPVEDLGGAQSEPYLRVVSYTGNQEALDAYLATLPEPEEPEPTQEEDSAAMLVDHEYRLTLLELGLVE